MPRSGELDRYVELLERKAIDDGSGGEQVTWSKLAAIWAKREDISGREVFSSGTAAEFDRRYIIRDPGLPMNATMRVRDPAGKGHPEFEIKHIAALPRRGEGFEILVTAVDRTGSVAL